MLDWSTHAHDYQKRAAAHLFERASAALWLDPGYGKSTVTLHAFKALVDTGRAEHMLIVAPLRVVQTVWAQEIENWSTLAGLKTARLHGTKKETWLKRRDVNVWLINYEGLPWLSEMAKAGRLPFVFDVVVFDEVRRMKNAQGLRFKSVRPIAALAKHRWGLTGTPASNGLMDLFGQFLILDGGAALGQRVTRFRHDYFEQHYDGFTWVPRPGAQKAIEKKIEPYIFRADGKLDLPDFVYDNRTVLLDAKARKTYTTLKNDLIASVADVTITAANAAVLMGKLKQMANGRVYDEARKVIPVHDAKREALAELVEELGDEQLLIAYEYNHDLTQIREVLGDDLPYLGAGVNERTAMEHVERWNRREIKIMAAHPASAGHGLNLQKGGAHHILWWGPTFDLDHYIQFNDRLRRQGNEAAAVVVHTFITENTVDETAIKAREEKHTLQSALLSALTVEFGESIKISTETENHTMQLTFKSDAAQAPQAPANPFAKGAPTAAPNPFAQAAPTAAPNPFAQGAPAAAPNPFAQGAPTAAPNPFAQGAPAAAPNPFAQGAPTAAPNPFAQGAPTAPVTQQQAIQQDVAAAPAYHPSQQQANPFSAFAQSAQPVEDAAIVESTSNPFAQSAHAPVAGGVGLVGGVPASDTGWVNPQDTAGNTIAGGEATQASVPLAPQADGSMYYTTIVLTVPVDRQADVLAAVARVLKK